MEKEGRRRRERGRGKNGERVHVTRD